MSSYLVALVVSDFKCIFDVADAGLDGKLPIGSCGRPNAINQLEFGLEIGTKAIEYYQRVFNKTPYPLPKCGMYHILFTIERN